MLRIAFVVTLAAAGCCPSKPTAGDPCHLWQPKSCVGDGEPSACGLNGYSCHDGKWREDFTYCNPPGPAPSPPPATVSSAAPPAPSATAPSAPPSAPGAPAALKLSSLVGLTLQQSAERLGVDIDDLTRYDEPPGKLRSVSIPAEKNGGVALQLYLEYQAADGMDAQRIWPAEKIGRLKVNGVTRRSPSDGGTRLERAGVTPEP